MREVFNNYASVFLVSKIHSFCSFNSYIQIIIPFFKATSKYRTFKHTYICNWFEGVVMIFFKLLKRYLTQLATEETHNFLLILYFFKMSCWIFQTIYFYTLHILQIHLRKKDTFRMVITLFQIVCRNRIC